MQKSEFRGLVPEVLSKAWCWRSDRGVILLGLSWFEQVIENHQRQTWNGTEAAIVADE
jgi:hypothetical protein